MHNKIILKVIYLKYSIVQFHVCNYVDVNDVDIGGSAVFCPQRTLSASVKQRKTINASLKIKTCSVLKRILY